LARRDLARFPRWNEPVILALAEGAYNRTSKWEETWCLAGKVGLNLDNPPNRRNFKPRNSPSLKPAR